MMFSLNLMVVDTCDLYYIKDFRVVVVLPIFHCQLRFLFCFVLLSLNVHQLCIS